MHPSEKEWMTPHIKDQIHARQRAWVKGDRKKYQQKREMVATLISSAKRRFYERKASDFRYTNLSKWFKYINSLCGAQQLSKTPTALKRLHYRKQRNFCSTLLLLLKRTESQHHCQSARFPMTWTTDLALFEILG